MSLGSATLLSKSSNSVLRIVFIAVCWSTGLLLGCCCAYSLPEHTFSMMRMLPKANVSIVSMSAQILFFLLITPLLLWQKNIFVLYTLAFAKAVCYGFVQIVLDYSFYDAGWLMRALLSFSGFFCNAGLLWFWFRSIAQPEKLKAHALAYASFMLPAICFDYFSVQPFVMALFQQL